MSLVISLNRYRQEGLAEPFVANRSMDSLNLALQSYMQGSMAGTQSGMDALRLQVFPLVQPLEDSDLLNPEHLAQLRAFADPQVRAELTHDQLTDLAKRVGHISNAIQQARAPVFVNGDNAAARRMARLTGPVSASLPPPSHRPERANAPVVYPKRGENREITVTFVDIVGFSPLGEELSHDEVFPVLNDVLERLEEAVESEGGEVPGNWGDALLAIYGLKRGENHARSAIRAALKMEKVLDDWNAHVRHPNVRELKIRSGTHTGEAAVGYLGGKARKVRTAIGRTVNIGARLEPLAVFEINESQKEYGILVSDSTMRSAGIRSFLNDPAGRKKLKGISEERETFRIRGAAPPSLVPPGADQTTFIGRNQELARLRREFEEVKTENASSMVIVKAEAGEGKSRLGDRFIEGLGNDVTLMITQGENREAVFPYEGIASAIRALAGIEPSDDIQRVRNKVKYVTQSATAGDQDAAEDLDRRLPFLWKLLNIADSNGKHASVFEEKESEIWAQVLQTVEILFSQLTRHRPVVLVLEDYHWMDPGSVVFVDKLLEKLHDRAFFCLALSRPLFVGEYLAGKIDEILLTASTDEENLHRERLKLDLAKILQMSGSQHNHDENKLKLSINPLLRGNPLYRDEAEKDALIVGCSKILQKLRIVSLSMLTHDQLRAIVEEILPKAPEKLVLQLLELSGGNPYLITVMASEINRGMSIERDETTRTWQFTSSSRGVRKTVPLPSGALGFMQAKFDLLEQEHQEMLRLAAVIGAEFTVKELTGLVEYVLRNDSDSKLLSEGVGETFLSHPDQILDELVISKVLLPVEDAPGKYQFPHALLREAAYEQNWKSERAAAHQAMANYLMATQPSALAMIASHFEYGQDTAKAERYYHMAAEATVNGDTENSIRLFGKAYRLATTPAQQFEVLKGWSEAVYLAGRYEEQKAIHALSLDLSAFVSQNDRSGIHLRRGRTLYKQSQYEEAVVELQHAIEILEENDEKTVADAAAARNDATKLRAAIYSELSYIFTETGHLAKGEEYARNAFAAAINTDNDYIVARAVWARTFAANQLGHYAGIFPLHEQAYKILQKRKDRRSIGYLVEWATTHIQLGNLKEAEALLQKAQDYARKFESRGLYAGYLTSVFGRLVHLKGQVAEACTILSDCILNNPGHSFILDNMIYLSLACVDKGDLAEARKWAIEALRLAEERKNYEIQALAKMSLAKIMSREGDLDSALAMSKKAMEAVAAGTISAEFDLEVLGNHARILSQFNRYREALDCIDLAKNTLLSRAATVDDSEYQQRFVNLWDGSRELMHAWLDLKAKTIRTETAVGLESIVSAMLHDLPVDDSGQSLKASQEEDEDRFNMTEAVVAMPRDVVFRSLLSQSIRIEINPSQYPDIAAKDLHLIPFAGAFAGADGRLYVYANWHMDISLPDEMKMQVFRNIKHGGYFEELFDVDVATSPEGNLHIRFKRSPKTKIETIQGSIVEIDPSLRVPPEQFGHIEWILTDLGDKGTKAEFYGEKLDFTYNIRNIFDESLRLIHRAVDTGARRD